MKLTNPITLTKNNIEIYFASWNYGSCVLEKDSATS